MDPAVIEETNRIRVSLGMKPLPVPGAVAAPESPSASDGEEPASTIDTRQAKAYDNYNQVLENEAAKRKREEKAAAVRKAREKAQRFALLEGKGLGEEAEGGDIDAKSWLMGQKKRQKKIEKARKLEEELAAAEAAAAAQVQYTSKDLAGIKVAHDSSAFLDGDEQILTLKDTTIGENEEDGDELENVGLRDQEKLTDRLDLKKKQPGYNPNDDEGDGILAQYDEEINGGKKKKAFTLDSTGIIAELSDILAQPVQNKSQKQSVNLDDMVGDDPTSNDYLDASEIKVKKPKKKKKNMRKKQDDPDDIFPVGEPPNDDLTMDLDTNDTAPTKKRKVSDDILVDDDDLQASLAAQRKNALKKRKRNRPEDFLKQLKEDDEKRPEGSEDGEGTGGLVIGEISEFVSSLSKPEDEQATKALKRKATVKSPKSEDEDHHMAGDDGDGDEHERLVKREFSESVPPEGSGHLNEDEEDEEEEKTVGAGMGAALALLRERGLVEKSRSGEQLEAFRDREEFLTRKRTLETELEEETRAQRERDRASGRMDRMSVREREDYARQQNNNRDFQQSRRMAELFSAGYKPNVELKYTDEHGRSLDRKEAFKHLSHQFHGKGSGKGKTEKRMKKIEDEKRREAQSLFDPSQEGMSRAVQQQNKKRKEAGVRLG